MSYFVLDPAHTDPKRLRKEREKAQRLKKSNWWRALKQKGKCEYCGEVVGSDQLTLDHRIPLARGGTSSPGNCVPSCHGCNQKKGLHTPVDLLLK